MSSSNLHENSFSRRSFIKTSALTVGAVSVLSRGTALAETVSIPTDNPKKLRRASPTSAKLEHPGQHIIGGSVEMDSIVTITSPAADPTCVSSDRIIYQSEVRLHMPGDPNTFPANGTVGTQNFFAAWRGGAPYFLVYSAHLTTQNGNTTAPTGASTTWHSQNVMIGGTAYKVGIEVEVSASGQNTVSVRARAKLKPSAGGAESNADWSPWRDTVWQPCD